MGTTRVKVIDLSSEEEVKAAKKHAPKVAEKILKESEKPQENPQEEQKEQEETTPKGLSKTKTKTTTPKGKKHHTGKKYQEAKAQVDPEKAYAGKEAIDLLFATKVTKFDPTVEAHINVTDQKIKGNVKFPHPISKSTSKKEKKYLVFADKKTELVGKTIIWADEETVSRLEKGLLKPSRDFDQVIASAKYMPQLVKVAKILGPAGMMPNPKNGTITENIKQALETTAGDDESWEFKTDPTAAIVHAKLGKLSNKPEEISENLKALISAIGQAKVKKAVINNTMGPGIKINSNSL